MYRWPNVVGNRYLAHVHSQDLLATAHVRQRHDDLPIETTRTQQRGIEYVGTVRRGDNDDAVVAFETIHLDEQLVQGLFALVVTTAESGATVTADCVDLVDENNTRRMLLRLFEHVTDTRGAHAHEHLDEVRTGNREERHFRFTSDGTRQQCLTGARRTHHQHALGNLASKALELRRILQKFDNLGEFFFGFFDTGHILKRDADLVFPEKTRLALAEGHRAAPPGTTLHLAHEVHPDADQQQDRE